MRRNLVALGLAAGLASCSAMETVLDVPMSLFDEESGEVVETTVGDAIADNAEGASALVSNALSGVHPGLALLGGGAAAALFGKARRRKTVEVVAEDPKETPEA